MAGSFNAANGPHLHQTGAAARRISENCAPLEEVQFICDVVTTAQLALTVVPRSSDLKVMATERGSVYW